MDTQVSSSEKTKQNNVALERRVRMEALNKSHTQEFQLRKPSSKRLKGF